jgi:hypothetical protein
MNPFHSNNSKYIPAMGDTATQTFRSLHEAERFRQQMQASYKAGEFTVYPTVELQFQTSLGEQIKYFEVTYRKWDSKAFDIGF